MQKLASLKTTPQRVGMSCSKCSDAGGGPCDPQSPASVTSEALPPCQARSRSRDSSHDVTWTRDTWSQGRLRSSDGCCQQRLRLKRPSGGQSQGWAEIQTSDGGDDPDGDDGDAECLEGSLFSLLVPIKRKYSKFNVFDRKTITVFYSTLEASLTILACSWSSRLWFLTCFLRLLGSVYRLWHPCTSHLYGF